MRNYASVNLKKKTTDLDCDPICDTSFFFSRQRGAQGTWIYPPRDTDPSRGRHRQHRAVTRVQLPGTCSAAAGRQHSPSSTPLPQPPSKHAGSKHSFQHPQALVHRQKKKKDQQNYFVCFSLHGHLFSAKLHLNIYVYIYMHPYIYICIYQEHMSLSYRAFVARK